MRIVILFLAALMAGQAVWADPAKDAERRKLEEQLRQAMKRRSDKEREIKGAESSFKQQEGGVNHELERHRKARDWMQKQFDQQIKGKQDQLGRIKKAQDDNDARAKKVAEDYRNALSRRADLKRRFEDRANAKQLEDQDLASRKQAELNATIDILRKSLEEDEAKLDKLAKEETREENQLVRQEAATMKMAKAYELAKQLESAITESYKDIKATETAISRKMSFKAASKITDVAKPERLEADVPAIELKPRTKEELDRQKKAQKEVVQETENMMDATLKMMDEAMEIVMPKNGDEMVEKKKSKEVRWLEEKDFEQQKLDEKIAQMEKEAEFLLEMDRAAAEDDAHKAKDLAALMNTIKADEKSKKEEDSKDAEAMKKALEQAQKEREAGNPPPELKGGEKWLQPGNVLAVGGLHKDDKVIPAKWMFISSWYVIGPFPNPNRINLRRKFAPESVIDLDATYTGKDGKLLRWTYLQANNADQMDQWKNNLKNAAMVKPDKNEEYAIYYAYAEVFFDKECDRWVAIGSDDRSDVWVNDFHVWGSSNKLKGWRLNEDYRRIHFKKGRNRILLRCENGHWELGWSMCIALEDGKAEL